MLKCAEQYKMRSNGTGDWEHSPLTCLLGTMRTPGPDKAMLQSD